jgi:DNA-binding transcriptional LysR family regulator
VALPNGHPLAAGKAVDIEQLRSEELLLLKEGHCLREHALAACRLADRREVQAAEATSLHTLVRMVDNGLGITLLPQRSCQASFAAAAAYLVRAQRKNAFEPTQAAGAAVSDAERRGHTRIKYVVNFSDNSCALNLSLIPWHLYRRLQNCDAVG